MVCTGRAVESDPEDEIVSRGATDMSTQATEQPSLASRALSLLGSGSPAASPSKRLRTQATEGANSTTGSFFRLPSVKVRSHSHAVGCCRVWIMPCHSCCIGC